jgi:hypothetical protein
MQKKKAPTPEEGLQEVPTIVRRSKKTPMGTDEQLQAVGDNKTEDNSALKVENKTEDNSALKVEKKTEDNSALKVENKTEDNSVLMTEVKANEALERPDSDTLVDSLPKPEWMSEFNFHLELARQGKIPVDSKHWSNGFNRSWTLAHEAAMLGILPEGFSQWDIATTTGLTVAKVALQYNTLPEWFDGWLIADADGWTIAHEAARFGKLPIKKVDLNLSDIFGRTVAEALKLRGRKPEILLKRKRLPDDFNRWSELYYKRDTYAHIAARYNFLPPGFNQWQISNKKGWSVAHEAAKSGSLPENFEAWDLVYTPNGNTVAHEAAIFGHLPKNFTHWDLKNCVGHTVKDFYEVFKEQGPVHPKFIEIPSYWRDALERTTGVKLPSPTKIGINPKKEKLPVPPKEKKVKPIKEKVVKPIKEKKGRFKPKVSHFSDSKKGNVTDNSNQSRLTSSKQRQIKKQPSLIVEIKKTSTTATVAPTPILNRFQGTRKNFKTETETVQPVTPPAPTEKEQPKKVRRIVVFPPKA